MNNFIKQVIEEKFASKAQQRFFYAKANEKDSPKKEKKKWSKWAKEFSDDTDFDNIPEKKKKTKKKEKEIDEIVDETGNIKRSKKPADFNSKGITQKKTTDDVVASSHGQMGVHALGPFGGGQHGTRTSLRYWAEGEVLNKTDIIEIALNKTLGADETILQNDDYEEAEKHFEKELGMDDEEAEERLNQLGYDKELPDDKIRLIENPKKYIQDFLETILPKKNRENEIVSKSDEIKEINPIIKKQVKSLKSSLENNNLSIDDIIKLMRDNE
jgi:hypothetical protein